MTIMPLGLSVMLMCLTTVLGESKKAIQRYPWTSIACDESTVPNTVFCTVRCGCYQFV